MEINDSISNVYLKRNIMVSVVIPCFKVRAHILDIILRIGPVVDKIYVVDDLCPEFSGNYVIENCKDKRVHVLFHQINKGVGGAVISGYKQAMADGAEIVVKLDGDGQMDPSLIPELIKPIVNGEADYCKGNRFFNIESLLVMPKIRLFGNSVLSLVNKMVNGYWNIIDPTNGFTAIHVSTLKIIPLEKVDKRYFFESDMLFRLSLIRAVVIDVPMKAVYGNELSNLKIHSIVLEFSIKFINRFFKRIFYNYILRDFNAGTLHLFLGLVLVLFGVTFGIYHWVASYESRTLASSGTVMMAAIPFILGFQMLLGGLNFDISNVPRKPLNGSFKSS